MNILHILKLDVNFLGKKRAEKAKDATRVLKTRFALGRGLFPKAVSALSKMSVYREPAVSVVHAVNCAILIRAIGSHVIPSARKKPFQN